MALNFNKNELLTPQVSELEVVTRKYNDYRKNLLFLVGFTVVNILLTVAGAFQKELYSADRGDGDVCFRHHGPSSGRTAFRSVLFLSPILCSTFWYW